MTQKSPGTRCYLERFGLCHHFHIHPPDPSSLGLFGPTVLLRYLEICFWKVELLRKRRTPIRLSKGRCQRRWHKAQSSKTSPWAGRKGRVLPGLSSSAPQGPPLPQVLLFHRLWLAAALSSQPPGSLAAVQSGWRAFLFSGKKTPLYRSRPSPFTPQRGKPISALPF